MARCRARCRAGYVEGCRAGYMTGCRNGCRVRCMGVRWHGDIGVYKIYKFTVCISINYSLT